MISSFDAWRTPAYKVGCALPSARGANPTFAGWHPIWHTHRREHRQAAGVAAPVAAQQRYVRNQGKTGSDWRTGRMTPFDPKPTVALTRHKYPKCYRFSRLRCCILSGKEPLGIVSVLLR